MANGDATQPQEISINTLPFWSRFTQTVDLRWDGNPLTLTRNVIPAGTQRIVFDYRKGERNVSALEGAQATARDTILVQANQTRGGGLYRIFGISYTKDGWPFVLDGNPQTFLQHDMFPPFSLQPNNGAAGPVVMTVEDWRSLDSFMTHIFIDNFRTEIRIDGTRRIIEMGPAPLYPGVGGAADGNIDTKNGFPLVENFMRITEGIVWNPAGAVDSNFQILLECSYDVVVPVWTTPDGTNPFVDPPAPIIGANPTPIGRDWTVGFICNLHGQEESPTSNIS
jgi:hypothetical protein